MTGSPTVLTVGESVTCSDRSACGVAAAAPAVLAPCGPVRPKPTQPDDVDTPSWPWTGPDCVGPITIPRELTRVLHVLATATAVDDFVPLWICATELVRRWSRDRPIRARVIREPRESVASPATGLADQAVSFRTALRRAADTPVAPAEIGRLVDVTILVSPDGNRLYIERMTSAADGPSPQMWARSFLRLLSALAGMPDRPVAAHPLTWAAEVLPDCARETVPSMAAGW